MPSGSTLYRAPRPTPAPRRCVLIAPPALTTLTGDPRAPGLRVRSGRTGRARTVPANDGTALAEALEAVVRPETTSVWLAERERLARTLGRPPNTIERRVRAIAMDHGLGMCGFTTRDPLGEIDAYDEVRDGAPVSTRRPSTHGSEGARDRP